MKPVQQLLAFLVYSNLFIAACALALGLETFYLLHLPASLHWFLVLLFLCTLFIYNLHYYVKTKKEKTGSRLQWCRKNIRFLSAIIVFSFLIIAALVVWHYKSVFFKAGYFNFNNLAWLIIIPLLALGYSYPLLPWFKKSLRQVGWLKMALLSFTWSFTTTVLPVLMFRETGNHYTSNLQVAILFIHHFIFIAALSFLFNINDHEEDKKDGIKTIAVQLGPVKSLEYGKWIMPLANTITSVLLIYFFNLNHPLYYAALLIPVGLLFFLYHRFSARKDEAAFVIRYDGLMIVKALLLIFAVLTCSS